MRRSVLSQQPGFTIMEVVVATTIFAVTVSSMMALLNYTLKINRRTEALRQTTQGMRNFMEFLVKEVRNGKIDYSVESGLTVENPLTPCRAPFGSTVGLNTNGNPSYDARDNRLGIVNVDNERECFYLADESGVPISPGTYAGSKLMMKKLVEGVERTEDITPQNFTVQELQFFVRPLKDPYADPSGAGNDYARVQPSVTIAAKFVVNLPTRETVDLYYQTTVSTNKYDIPH